MTAQEWYREASLDAGAAVRYRLQSGSRLEVREMARIAAHFARLALGCDWTREPVGDLRCIRRLVTSCGVRVHPDNKYGTFCPFCGAPIVEAVR